MRLSHLCVENQHNPIGLEIASPRFGWRFEEAPANFVQEGYQIQISTDPALGSFVWDSGDTSTGDSQWVVYRGPRLEEKTRYFWRVLAWGGGVRTPWSGIEWFETAPKAGSWTAPFISPESPQEVRTSRPKALRKDFELPFVPAGARIRATALGLYELFLNGTRVGDAVLTPGWTAYQKRLAYQTYDVTALLKKGTNHLRAHLGVGWYKGEITWLKSRNLYGKHLALAAEVEAWDDGGQVFRLTSDGTWQAADFALSFAEIYHGEVYDARFEGKETWGPVRVLKAPATALVAQDGPLVRRQAERTAHKISTPAGGYVLDFGQVLTGWVRFTVQGQDGDRVVISHAETLDAKGNFYTKNLRHAKNRIDYTLKGGSPETFEPRFSFQGFRYIRLEDWPGKDRGKEPDPRQFTAIVVHSDMSEALEFSCSHPGLNQLHHNISWGWIGNAVDVPTDCPQRDERLGWTGDAQIFSATASRLRHADRFFAKWFRDIRADQYADGSVPFVVPDVLTHNPKKEPMMRGAAGSTGWGDIAVIGPWQVWLASGDQRILEEFWPLMQNWVEFIRSQARDEVLWDSGFHFGDWVALDAKEGSFFGATPNDLSATAYYAYSTDLLAQAARVLGKSSEAQKYEKLHSRIVRAFQDEFFTPRGRLAARTQTAHILALVFGLVPERDRARTIGELAKLLEENDGHLTTGFLGTPAFCDALVIGGRLDLAYELLLKEDYPSWLYQIGKGATTVWEHWDGLKPDGTMWSTKMNSFNHYAYGAVGDWMYRTLGGIRLDPSGPGYKKIVFQPQPGGGITWSKQAIDSPYGRVALNWKIEDETWTLTLEIPANTTGRLVLPDGERTFGAGTWTVSVRRPQF